MWQLIKHTVRSGGVLFFLKTEASEKSLWIFRGHVLPGFFLCCLSGFNGYRRFDHLYGSICLCIIAQWIKCQVSDSQIPSSNPPDSFVHISLLIKFFNILFFLNSKLHIFAFLTFALITYHHIFLHFVPILETLSRFAEPP